MLHRHGYSYQDLNDGNFFINPESGDVLICDNDNVMPQGVVIPLIYDYSIWSRGFTEIYESGQTVALVNKNGHQFYIDTKGNIVKVL